MIETPQQFDVLMDELGSATWTLAAIGALFDTGLADALTEPRTVAELAAACPGVSRERIARCLAVAEVRGVVVARDDRYQIAPGVRSSLDTPRRLVVQGDYRSHLLQAAAYIREASEAQFRSGWRHVDPMILQAQGDGSAMFATALKHHFLPELGDLGERLDGPEARFLDVGAGVGALTIAMCQEFPKLRAVGLDPRPEPTAIARNAVTRAGLGDRIELRPIQAQALDEAATYDLAWLPSFFLGDEGEVRRAVARLTAALRPGGWLLFPALNPAAGQAQCAVWSLVMEAWGGPVIASPEAEALLASAALRTRVFAGPAWHSLVVGQRAGTSPG